jgi:hypothetical protein
LNFPCGVLGEASADADTIGKREACDKAFINVSDLTDLPP